MGRERNQLARIRIVELRSGTIINVELFPEARKPAYIIHADFGSELEFANQAPRSRIFTNQAIYWVVSLLVWSIFRQNKLAPALRISLPGFTQIDGLWYSHNQNVRSITD
ncbi:MAG: hypothetical protein CM1200mP41_22260 [Gammaproteobacteria bacterium]|nr:MAG: hypothetical protein CM1200mP41_22260 [Gammaproteobacteria bacterium]